MTPLFILNCVRHCGTQFRAFELCDECECEWEGCSVGRFLLLSMPTRCGDAKIASMRSMRLCVYGRLTGISKYYFSFCRRRRFARFVGHKRMTLRMQMAQGKNQMLCDFFFKLRSMLVACLWSMFVRCSLHDFFRTIVNMNFSWHSRL